MLVDVLIEPTVLVQQLVQFVQQLGVQQCDGVQSMSCKCDEGYSTGLGADANAEDCACALM